MATVINRITKQVLRSVNTPDYDSAVWIINPYLYDVQHLPLRYWKIISDTVVEMTQLEKDVADVPLIVLEITRLKGNVRTDAMSMVYTRYSVEEQVLFNAMMTIAAYKGKTNRRDYCENVFIWIGQVYAWTQNRIVEINALTTLAGLQAYIYDYSVVEAIDPGNTIAGALAITD